MDLNFSLSLFNIIGLGVVFYGLLVASLLLFSESPHKSANRMLAAILLIGTWFIIATMLVFTGNFVHIAPFFRIGLPTFYAVPPLILWYVKARTDKSFSLKPLDFLHFLPALLAAIDCIPFHLLSFEQKVQEVRLMSEDLRYILEAHTGILPDYMHFFIRPAHGLIYISVSALFLYQALQDKKLRKEIESQYRLKTWLIIFIVFFLVLYPALFLINFVWVCLPYPTEELSKLSLIPSSICVILFLVVHIFLMFNTHIIFGKQPSPKPKGTSVSSPNSAVSKTSVSSSGSPGELMTEMERLIQEKQLFKNPKITAPEVASMLGVAPHVLSNTLNSTYGKRFPDLINSYRIQYVIEELKKGSTGSMSIEGIATEAGFASRSAFYNSFKKITQLTPSEYIKQQNLG